MQAARPQCSNRPHSHAVLQGPEAEDDDDDEVPHTSASIHSPVPHSKMLREGTGSGDGGRASSDLGDPSSSGSTLTGRLGSGSFAQHLAAGGGAGAGAGAGPSRGGKSPPRKGSRRGVQSSSPPPKLLSKWKPTHNVD